MSLSKVLASAILLCAVTREGAGQTVVLPSCNARETPTRGLLPAPSREVVEPARSPEGERLREAMQHLDAARRTPCTPYPPPRPTLHFCGTPSSRRWPSPPFDESDRGAADRFAAAARCCPAAAAAVLADAIVTNDSRIVRRALGGVARGWRTENSGDQRLTTQLLFLSSESRWDDASNEWIAESAINLLSQQLAGPTTDQVRKTLVQEVMNVWPATNAELRLSWDTSPLPAHRPCGDGSLWLPPCDFTLPRTTRLVLVAAMTGDRALIDRLVPSGTDPTAPNRANPQHVRFVLRFMALAAPHVDAETARLLHTWYMPHVLGGLDLGAPANVWSTREQMWRTDALDVVMGIYSVVPDNLLASYAPLFKNGLRGGTAAERWPDVSRR